MTRRRSRRSRNFHRLVLRLDTTNANNFPWCDRQYIAPMVVFPTFPRMGRRRSSTHQIPPTSGAKDLKDSSMRWSTTRTRVRLSRANYPAPVTSNPSPGYVYRVAQFSPTMAPGTAQSRRGGAGDSDDYEARSTRSRRTASFGKLKEPVLRTQRSCGRLMDASNAGAHWSPSPWARRPRPRCSRLRCTRRRSSIFEPNYSSQHADERGPVCAG